MTSEIEPADAHRRRELMARCAMSEVTTHDWTFKEDVTGYARDGWGGIGVWLHKLEPGPFIYEQMPSVVLDASVIEAAATEIREAGLGIASLIATGLFTEPDPDARQARLEHALFAIDAARRLGTDCLIIVPGARQGASYEEAMDRVVDTLSRLAEPAASAGVRLAIEPLHPRHVDFCNTLPEALDLVERVGHEGCGVFVDLFQLSETPNLLDDIRASAGRLFGVHVADAPRELRWREDRFVPGEGVLPLRDMLAAIVDAGYDGWFDVEIMSRELWASDYDALLHRCAQGLTDLLLDVEGVTP